MNGSQESAEQPTIFLLVMLGALTAFAPFVTDMYLPALPSMQMYFETSVSMVQLGLTTSMIGLAVGQLVIGPLSDKYGRKIPLMITLLCFSISSALCIFSSSIEMFTVMRLIQGLGASGGVVLSRSIATDLYAGSLLSRIMAMIGAISGIAPVISPVIGGILLSLTSWRGIFGILLFIGILLFLASWKLPESYPQERRRAMSLWQSFSQVTELFKNRLFVLYGSVQFFVMFAFFGNIASSPFIFQTHYGFGEFGFSFFFAVNAITIAVFAGLSVKFRTPQQSVKVGTTVLLFACVFTSLMLGCGAPVAAFELGLWLMHACFGLIFAPVSAIAMNASRRQAGVGSAVFGAGGFLAGGMASPLVGQGDMTLSAGIVFVIGAVATFVCARLAQRFEPKSDEVSSIDGTKQACRSM